MPLSRIPPILRHTYWLASPSMLYLLLMSSPCHVPSRRLLPVCISHHVFLSLHVLMPLHDLSSRRISMHRSLIGLSISIIYRLSFTIIHHCVMFSLHFTCSRQRLRTCNAVSSLIT
ncbi:hypothetical protein BD626DRAFT_28084 [Schizophyllum amplum]|uniref:Uncharacterized protein n=1 Tax=Schizophyllum amplum TaxID=97359 RepID=A0A550D019_9AGAR|nr:hypothetical protein BD626DRAFT_28084 [Auriculariopsis ampla]